MINVALATERSSSLRRLRRALEKTGDIRVAAEVGDVNTVVAAAQHQLIEVVILCGNRRRDEQIATIRELAYQLPTVPIVLLVPAWDDDYVLQAITVGASACLLQVVSRPELAAAVRAVAQGHAIVSPDILNRIIYEYQRLSAEQQHGKKSSALHEDERNILELIVAGLSNRQIAVQLGLAVSTVKNKMRFLFGKLGVHDRTQAAIFVLRHRLRPDGAMKLLV